MHVQFLTYRWYPSRQDYSLSMLHYVMEAETACAALVLALKARRVILKTRLIYETAIKSQRNFFFFGFGVLCGWLPVDVSL